jgi:uncharacterized protein (TIGR04255 family)
LRAPSVLVAAGTPALAAAIAREGGGDGSARMIAVGAGRRRVRARGLRFIDEIRVEEVEGADQWDPYVSTDLLAPVRYAARFDVQSAETQLMLRLADDVQGVVCFGPRTGFAVDPRGRLKLTAADADGQFFLLDIDTAWHAPPDTLVPLAPAAIAAICWRLDEPSHLLFESAITDRAREIFRKEPS